MAPITEEPTIKQATILHRPKGKARMRGFSGEWQTHRIDMLAEVDPEYLPSNTDPEFVFNYVSLDHVDAGRLLGYTMESFATAPSRARRVLRNNDVLMSTVRPALQGHLLYRGQLVNGVCSTGFAVLRAKPDQCNPRFLFAHLFSDPVGAQLQAILAGSNYPAISSRDVRRLAVACPPTVAEQHAIAAVLSDVDELIGSLEALIAKKRDIKQAAMQQLLTGRTRLPGFGGEWEKAALGGLADIRNGGTPRTGVPSYWGGLIPWCVPTDITASGEKYLVATTRNITPEGLASCGASLLPVGTLLLCSRATIGEIKIASMPVATNQGFKSLICGEAVDYEFLYYRLLTLKDRMVEVSTGSTFLEISKRDVANICIDLPPLPEQRAIATVLSDMDAEITALERRLDKTRAIKQGMMQQLLTGAIRLPIPDADTEDDHAHDA